MKTNFHNKNFALNLAFKMRTLQPRSQGFSLLVGGEKGKALGTRLRTLVLGFKLVIGLPFGLPIVLIGQRHRCGNGVAAGGVI